MTHTGIERFFNTLQFAWEFVATPCFTALCLCGQFLRTSPFLALPLYSIVAIVAVLGWLLFGWIGSAMWAFVRTVIKLAWYSPLGYVFVRGTRIIGGRVLRRMGQQQRAETLIKTMQQVIQDWVRAMGERLLSRWWWQRG